MKAERSWKKEMHRHTAFIFNGFLLLEMPQGTWSARLYGNQRTEGGGWEIGKGGERENNFTRASMVCSHFVIDFLKRKGKKMLRPPCCGISRLIRTTSCSAAVLSGLCQ